MKYRPGFPDRFGCIEHGRAHCGDFFPWYNNEHRHGGLGLLTPHDVHYGLAAARLQARDTVLTAAFAARPERFPAGAPSAGVVPTEVWINRPVTTASCGGSTRPCPQPLAEDGVKTGEAAECSEGSLDAVAGQWHLPKSRPSTEEIAQ